MMVFPLNKPKQLHVLIYFKQRAFNFSCMSFGFVCWHKRTVAYVATTANTVCESGQYVFMLCCTQLCSQHTTTCQILCINFFLNTGTYRYCKTINAAQQRCFCTRHDVVVKFDFLKTACKSEPRNKPATQKKTYYAVLQVKCGKGRFATQNLLKLCTVQRLSKCINKKQGIEDVLVCRNFVPGREIIRGLHTPGQAVKHRFRNAKGCSSFHRARHSRADSSSLLAATATFPSPDSAAPSREGGLAPRPHR